MNITVYCGANCGNRPEYVQAAKELGKWMAENGHTLIYGGGAYGMMGNIAEAVINNGGSAVGVTPNIFVDSEEVHRRISEVEIVPTLSVRRDRMLEMGDAFIALPGGIGTLDEITEVIALTKLGLNSGPCILYNVSGYYEKLRAVFNSMVDEGFLDEGTCSKIIFADSIEDINEELN